MSGRTGGAARHHGRRAQLAEDQRPHAERRQQEHGGNDPLKNRCQTQTRANSERVHIGLPCWVRLAGRCLRFGRARHATNRVAEAAGREHHFRSNAREIQSCFTLLWRPVIPQPGAFEGPHQANV